MFIPRIGQEVIVDFLEGDPISRLSSAVSITPRLPEQARRANTLPLIGQIGCWRSAPSALGLKMRDDL